MSEGLAFVIGGIGFFLIGIELLSRGFQEAAGNSLRRILAEYAGNTFKGVAAGFVVSTAVQSASAVIGTLIGFVNARILTLRQAITMVFGANLGKISVCWIIATIGFGFHVETVALYLLGGGALVKAVLKRKGAGVGTGMIGFALLFLGLESLKHSFGIFNESWNLTSLVSNHAGTFLCFAIGAGMTVIMQSSTGAMAITFSALAGGWISPENAAGMVIGENLGTLSGALMSSLGSSSAAKRLTAAHIIFNLCATLVAGIFLAAFRHGGFFDLVATWQPHARVLALSCFYSLIIAITVTILLPFQKSIESWLENHFAASTALGSPKFLNDKIINDPRLALAALRNETIRFGQVSAQLLATALKWKMKNGWILTVDLSDEERELDRLADSIHRFATKAARNLPPEAARSFQKIFLASRHFETVSDLSKKIAKLKGKFSQKITGDSFETMRRWTDAVCVIVENTVTPLSNGDGNELKLLTEDFVMLEQERPGLRQAILDAGITHEIDSSQTIILVDLVDSVRRAAREQFEGIDQTWDGYVCELPTPEVVPADHLANVIPLTK